MFAATQTAATLFHNLKLQSTASKNHAEQTELEGKTLEAREVKELLAIVRVIRSIHRKVMHASLNAPTAIDPRCAHRGWWWRNKLLHVLPAFGGQDGPDLYHCCTYPQFTGFLEWLGLGNACRRLRGMPLFFPIACVVLCLE